MAKRNSFGRVYRRRMLQPGGGRVESGPYWIEYYANGKQVRESSKSDKFKDAEALLLQRRLELTQGNYGAKDAQKTTIAELLDDLLDDFRTNQRSVAWAEIVDRHLRPALGQIRASQLTSKHIHSYIQQRQNEGVCTGTINRELGRLRRSFNLGMQAEPPRVTRVPRIPRLAENAPRTGFLEHTDYLELLHELPSHLKGLLAFGYYSGCRKGEVLSLHWEQIDVPNKVVRLRAQDTKTRQARLFSGPDELWQMIEMLRTERDLCWPECEHVFSRYGKPILDFRGAWEEASGRAGLVAANGRPKFQFHDLRRTAVRNMIRAGVPERVAMLISGHKTRSMLDRYNIVDERDFKNAGKRLEVYLAGIETPEVEKANKRDPRTN